MRALLIILLCSIQLHAAADDSVTVRVRLPEDKHAWTLSFVNGTDTAVHSVVNDARATFRIRPGATYFFYGIRDDSDASEFGYVGTAGHCPSDITLTMLDDSIAFDNDEISRFHSILLQFRTQLWSSLTLGRTGKDTDKLLDTMLAISTAMQLRFERELNDVGLRTYGIEHTVEPLRRFVVVAQLRTAKLYEILSDSVDRTLDTIRLTRALQGIPQLPSFSASCESDNILVFGINSFITSIKVAVQHHHGTEGVAGMLWARDPAIALTVVGSGYKCALQQQLLGDVWEGWPGFTSSTDSTFTAIARLASDPSNAICRSNTTLIQEITRALDIASIDGFNALNVDGIMQTLMIHPDSIYVLHFWGTWCGPCMESRDTVNTIAASLDSSGVRTIHIAYEPRSSFKRWKKVVGEHSADNVFIPYSNKGDHIVNRLGIHLVPTYFVVGKNRKIRSRFNDHTLIVPNVRASNGLSQ